MSYDDYQRYLGGDDAGIIAIVNTYRSGLLLYVNSYVKNYSVAEDLVEDTFFRVMVKKPPILGRRSFKAWLYTIARHITIDYLRKNKYEHIFSSEAIQELASIESLEEMYLAEERRICVHRALSKIKYDYRQALYLSYFEDFNNEQIAKIMGKSKRQVEMLLYRGKQALETTLVKEGLLNENE